MCTLERTGQSGLFRNRWRSPIGYARIGATELYPQLPLFQAKIAVAIGIVTTLVQRVSVQILIARPFGTRLGALALLLWGRLRGSDLARGRIINPAVAKNSRLRRIESVAG